MTTRISSPLELVEPRLARLLFADPRGGLLWLVIRLLVGWQWLEAGLEKWGAPAWTGEKAGAGVAGFAQGAIAKATGEHPAVQSWYADFLHNVVVPNAALFGYLVTAGEILVGVGLLVGGLTAIAAFFGVVMNTAYLLAGTVSINPLLLIPSILLILAWRNAGWWGADRILLPRLGTPWQPLGRTGEPAAG